MISAADELFYAHGIHAVGIDRVIARAGVAKATLYAHFPSKDHLVAAYLTERIGMMQGRIRQAADGAPPRDGEMILATIDEAGKWCGEENCRGCNFVNAAAEYPEPGIVMDVLDEYRRRLHDFYAELADRCGYDRAERLAAICVSHFDGIMVSAHMDRDPCVGEKARESLTLVLAAWPHRHTSDRTAPTEADRP
ncbi:AcrR family transcriptional regulator [Spinactinospora alkalitolerans]|uniref:AcrR family transcriptional regulator n=1 Tax=Spinactinospora alkalitolerans TaxID=687207 RepID=A0A852U4J9_9ACTN|nr:TetR/AcrR family transcriptional regulator [Spinactinospora alkalitolerans]NYE50422.1 AcrR family transcriptional regulator [Spinactinospora alkalitolerans]